jgi:glycosyltransferase involved in cell wall biosynthesis
MSIAFLLPTPIPVEPEADAYAQEIAVLRQRFGGELLYLNPNNYLPRHLPWQIPRPFFGFHQLHRLRRLSKSCRLFQIYSPTLYPYPVLARLRRPVVYTLTGGAERSLRDAAFFRRLAAVTVADEVSLERLRNAGLENVRLVHAGIDTARFEHHPAPADLKFHLLMASAPWTKPQFESKGVDALLQAAQRRPDLRLTFLWRGILTQEMLDRVRRAGLEDRVQVVDEQVDVNEILAGVHATVNLASSPDIVKAQPHSLLESLAAGKPVLVSRAIPFSAYVEKKRVGEIVEEVTPQAVLQALDRLREGYSACRSAAVIHGKTDFALEAMVSSFAEVYRRIVSPLDAVHG